VGLPDHGHPALADLFDQAITVGEDLLLLHAEYVSVKGTPDTSSRVSGWSR
jgi:hypothetical protein